MNCTDGKLQNFSVFCCSNISRFIYQFSWNFHNTTNRLNGLLVNLPSLIETNNLGLISLTLTF